jgi:hypothetical protein
MGYQALYRRIPELPSSPIDFSASGDNEIITAIPGSRITVYGIWFVTAGATVVTLKDGASNEISGPVTLAANQEVQLPLRGEPWVTTAVGNAFIINSTNAVQIGGIINYQTSLGSATGYDAIILYDSSLVRWAVTITSSGNLDTNATPAGPSNALEVDPLVLTAPNGTLYQVTIETTGNLTTTVVGAAISPYTTIQIGSRVISVSNAGNLITT